MQYDLFVEGVRHRLVGSSHEEAEQAVKAVIATLAESLDREGRRMLASQLPDRFQELFPEKAVPADYGQDEFLSRVSRRAGASQREPKELVRVVLEFLRQGLPAGEMFKILDHLPEALRSIGGQRIEEGRSPDTHVRSI